MYELSVFIFTRDLRLEDNTGLMMALKESKKVLPIFIFNPKQVDKSNKYRSNNCVQFMVECLVELDEQLRAVGSRLFYFYDSPQVVIGNLLKESIDAVYMNMDYTPFARKRVEEIRKACGEIPLYEYEDYMLTGVNTVLKGDGLPYSKFTPYYRVAKKIKVPPVKHNKYHNYVKKSQRFKGEFTGDVHSFYESNDDLEVNGGRSNAIGILKKIKHFRDYDNTRDYPASETTHLSAYLKFNVVSIREVYHVFKKGLNNKLITQLYWRDFYMMIIYHFPHVIGHPMKPDYYIDWVQDSKVVREWQVGNTGFPMVDAGMRQMNATGWMHNRARMIVANFLVKILHVDWQIGEQYFARMLVDYDPANNNGGWQWSASTGSDSQPYFRIFNPWRQSEKYDENAEYIKRWIPELKDVPAKDIHNWGVMYKKYPKVYVEPIVSDLGKEVERTIRMYKKRRTGY